MIRMFDFVFSGQVNASPHQSPLSHTNSFLERSQNSLPSSAVLFIRTI